MRHTNPTNVTVFAALVTTLLLAQALPAWAQSAPVIKCPEGWPGNGSRAIALISDLHFGVGKLSDGTGILQKTFDGQMLCRDFSIHLRPVAATRWT